MLICCAQGRIQRGAGGHAPPNRRLSGFFLRKKNWLCWDCTLYQKCSVDLKYAKNASAHDAPPDPLVAVGEGDTPPQSPSLSASLESRFWRLRRSASVPPNVKSWLRPWLCLKNTRPTDGNRMFCALAGVITRSLLYTKCLTPHLHNMKWNEMKVQWFKVHSKTD